MIFNLNKETKNNIYLKDNTGPTSLKISFKFSSVASYGIFPTIKYQNLLLGITV